MRDLTVSHHELGGLLQYFENRRDLLQFAFFKSLLYANFEIEEW